MLDPLTISVPVEQEAPKPKVYHKMCAVEARRRQQGRVGEMLCGAVHSGPKRPTSADAALCPMCEDLVGPHRARCRDCQALGWA